MIFNQSIIIMKKFYSLLTLVLCLLAGVSAQAKTATVTINEPDGAAVINTSTTYMPIQFIEGVAENVELGSDGGLQVSLNRGYDLKEIKVNETVVYGNYVSASEIPDGALVAITLEKLQAKHVTFTVDNPAAVSLYDTANYNYYYFNESGTMDLDLQPTSYININANSGFDIDEIKIDGTVYTGGNSIPASAMNDNGTVAITTKEKEATVYYVEADPALVTLTIDYSNIYDASNSVDGTWTIQTTNPYASMSISAIDGYVITSIERVAATGDNEQLLNDYTRNQQSANVYLGSYPSGTTFRISAANLSELRSAHVSVEVVDGTPDQITVRRGNEEIPAADFASIAIIPGSDQLYISASTYGNNLYKVTVNDQSVEAQGTGYNLTNLQNNDVIKVWPNFPEVAVPLNINFTNEGSSDVLTLSVNGVVTPNDQLLAGDYTVMLGSRLGFTFNNSAYSVSSVTLNGQNMSSYGFEYTVLDETPVNVEITAAPLRDYKVTVYFEPGTINIYRGWGESDPVAIPDGADEVTFDVSPSNNQLTFKAADGYVISSIVDGNDNTYSSSVYVSSDITLTVYTEKIVRDRVCALYLGATDGGWIYSQLTLSPGNDARKEIPLTAGYNIIEYGAFDCPFQLGLYPTADVYVNGTLAENYYGEYPALQDLASGSVIKVFGTGTDVPTYQLTITDTSNGAIAVMADYVNSIDSSVAQVLGTTDIEFVYSGDVTYIIKVNGNEVTPDADGRLIATIDSDATITIDENTLLEGISVDAKDATIYNLQGIRVNNPGKGIYIVNGKKVKF